MSAAVAPVILWADKPEIVEAATGRSPYTLKQLRKQGLPCHVIGEPPHVRYFWIPSEVQNFFLAISRTEGIGND